MLALKRPREMTESPQAPEPACSPHRLVLLESPATKRTRAQAEANSTSGAGSQSAFVAAVLSAGASTVVDHACASSRHQRVCPQTGEQLFSLEQVKDIVRRAVDERERGLREQYERILQHKLQEQYQAFAKFNEDYISRQLKNNDLNYIS